MKNNCNAQNNELLKAFNVYTGNYEDDPDVNSLKSQYITSAREIVEGYLGFRLDIHDVTETHVFVGSRDIPLRECPAQDVYGVFYGGKQIPPMFYTLNGDTLHLNHHGCGYQDDFPICSGMEIVVTYCAGYRKLPDIIIQTILRIASLLQTEANSNIGITSKSYSDGSRSFLNFSNFDKYLQPLYPLRTYKLT